MILNKKVLELYNLRMKKIQNNIWDLVENFEYYRKIRGIMDTYKEGKELSKRQLIRLYQFIIYIPENVIKKEELDDLYNHVYNKMVEKSKK